MFIYYVYAYLRDDNTPYYIGKGKDNRAYQKHVHVSTPPDRNRIVFLETHLSEVGAYALERRYIRWYGKKMNVSGILHNIQDGGEGGGMLGKRHSPDTIAKMSQAAQGRVLDDATCQKKSAAMLGRKLSFETRAKISRSNPRKRCCTDGLSTFDSVTDLANAHNLTRSAALNRLKSSAFVTFSLI